LPENWCLGLNANSEFKIFFKEKEIRIRFIIYQQEESMSQSTIFPLVRENVHLLKENSGAQLDCVTRCNLPLPLALIFQESGTSSLKLNVLVGRFTAW
jgi:hypothetical protein